MKKKVVKISIVAMLLVTGNQLFAKNAGDSTSTIIQQDTITESFKVYGNCGMCKKTIEGSLKDHEGIYTVNWDKETKIIELSYNKDAVSLEEIKKKIAEVGYDTEEYRASNEAYNNLPACCQYERPEEK